MERTPRPLLLTLILTLTLTLILTLILILILTFADACTAHGNLVQVRRFSQPRAKPNRPLQSEEPGRARVPLVPINALKIRNLASAAEVSLRHQLLVRCLPERSTRIRVMNPHAQSKDPYALIRARRNSTSPNKQWRATPADHAEVLRPPFLTPAVTNERPNCPRRFTFRTTPSPCLWLTPRLGQVSTRPSHPVPITASPRCFNVLILEKTITAC